ncbi:MAG TPA: tetratricopeptide repeat protein [Candidatus Krumholzibacterium sp.]|nr:tetratricopeptide repeat protein [Candidatus Krumholzibacterium sp.]
MVRAQDNAIPLAEQLDGLAPGPRIAYVTHLIREGRDDAEAFFQLAVAWHESSVPDSAILYYRKAIEKDLAHFKSFVNLGVLYDDSGDLIEAEKNFESAVKINPDDVLANSHLAFMIFQQKRYDKAWEYLSHALELAPDHPQPRFYLAIFFWESKMYREAMREWEKVVEVDPGSYLAERATENIQLLQRVLNSPTPPEDVDPVR